MSADIDSAADWKIHQIKHTITSDDKYQNHVSWNRASKNNTVLSTKI